MSDSIHHEIQQNWLKQYYFSRTLFSVLWVIAVFTIGHSSPFWASLLLILYPA